MRAGDVLDLAFERIYVINLEARSDRRRDLNKHLAAIGLNPERVCYFSAVRPGDRGRWPSIGARGCFLSHLNIFRQAAEEGSKSVLILEDDAETSSAFRAHPDAVWDQLRRSDWEYLHGGVVAQERCTIVPQITPCDPETGIVGSHFVALRGEAICQVARYLSDMADRPAGSPAGGPMHVDGAYSWFRREHPKMRSFTFAPSLAHQRASSSDVAEKQWYDQVPVARDLSAVARRLKNRMIR